MNPAAWIGRSHEASEELSELHVAGMRATLPLASTLAVPLGVHWLLGQPRVAAGDLGADGHPRPGLLLPAVSHDRVQRLWAASSIEFVKPFDVGDVVTRRTTIEDVALKSGRTGTLTFITLRHEHIVRDAVVLAERQTLAYRPPPAVGAAVKGPEVAADEWPVRRQVVPDTVMLFRYSALTFNGHRIHYDHLYATQVEGHAGIVVHAPLLATLLLDLAACMASPHRVQSFAFRAGAPSHAGGALWLEGRPSPQSPGVLDLRTRTDSGELRCAATAHLSPFTVV